MSKIEVDLNAGPRVLAAARNMLNELLSVEDDEEITAPEHVNVDNAEPGTVDESNQSADGPEVDMNDVIFHVDFCGRAAEPFYTSGRRKGQWKKRRGLSDTEYDRWYSQQHKADIDVGENSRGRVNTGAAFNREQPPPEQSPVPKDCGAFMGWVSAKQADGLITQEDVGDAYVKTGVQVTDLFPPNTGEVVGRHVAALYEQLVIKAGA